MSSIEVPLTNDEIRRCLHEIQRLVDAPASPENSSHASGLCCDLASALRGDALMVYFLRGMLGDG